MRLLSKTGSAAFFTPGFVATLAKPITESIRSKGLPKFCDKESWIAARAGVDDPLKLANDGNFEADGLIVTVLMLCENKMYVANVLLTEDHDIASALPGVSGNRV